MQVCVLEAAHRKRGYQQMSPCEAAPDLQGVLGSGVADEVILGHALPREHHAAPKERAQILVLAGE